MKKFMAVLLLALFTVSFVEFGGNTTLAKDVSKVMIMRIAHTLAPDSHYQKGLLKFAEIFEKKSGGQVKVEIFHDSQLGSERDAVEGVSMGTIECTLSSTGPLANFSKKFMAFDLPFIIQDRDKAFKVMDGKVGKSILDSVADKGLIGLGFWENGFRMITNSKQPINTPKDIAGLKIRLMENPVHMETFRVLGAQPVPMPFGELFTAMQQKTVDGQENPLVIIYTSKFYEVQKYLALTGHFYSPSVFLVSKSFYNKLSPKLQKDLVASEKEARTWERKYCVELEKDLVSKLKANGMVVTTPNKKLLQQATKSVYDKFRTDIGGDIIDALLK